MIFAASAFEHVLDSLDWHLSDSLHLHIPLPGRGINFGITKYSLLMMLAAGLICWIYIPLARRISKPVERLTEAPSYGVGAVLVFFFG